MRDSRSQAPTQELIRIAAPDPLNLVGIILPGDRVPANSGRSFDLRDGVVVESDPTPIENLRNARAG
jgi:ATP-dependent Lhr-like helicase